MFKAGQIQPSFLLLLLLIWANKLNQIFSLLAVRYCKRLLTKLTLEKGETFANWQGFAFVQINSQHSRNAKLFGKVVPSKFGMQKYLLIRSHQQKV